MSGVYTDLGEKKEDGIVTQAKATADFSFIDYSFILSVKETWEAIKSVPQIEIEEKQVISHTPLICGN